MRRLFAAAILFSSIISLPALATTFIVATDDELVRKSEAIVIGRVEGAYTNLTSTIETVQEIRIERSIKGPFRAGDLVRIHVPGGAAGSVAVIAPGAPVFATGERDLLFLNVEGGRWQTTDLMIGKFRFAESNRGEHFLVRDYDDVEAFDREGAEHREPLRREQEFLMFVKRMIRGEHPPADYFVFPSGDRGLARETNAFAIQPNIYPAPPHTYSSYVNCSTCPVPNSRPIRWPSISAGVPFYKNSAQNLAGAPDGGVNYILNGLSAWNNECGSVINLTYAGQTATQAFNLDGTDVIEFNDPRGQVTGSCSPGSGCVVALTQVAINAEHSFAGSSWWSIFDADTIFNDGYAVQTSTQASMNHELGHGIGLRHSNASYLSGNDSANTCTPDSECTTTDNSAIMFWRALGAGPVLPLMDWDRHAAQALYPGGSCSGGKDDFDHDGIADLVWRNTSTGQNAVWFMNGDLVKSSTFINGAGLQWTLEAEGDVNGDGQTDILWRNYSTGETAVWFMSGTSVLSTAFLPSVSPNWHIEGSADFNGDAHDDLVWRNSATGENAIWYMNGGAVSSSVFFNSLSTAWTLAGTGDFDANGKPDLIWRNYSTGQNAVWYMDNNVLVATAYINSIPTVWRLEAVGDFDGSGTTDLVFRNYSTGQNALWLLNGTTVVNSYFLSSVGPDWHLRGGR